VRKIEGKLGKEGSIFFSRLATRYNLVAQFVGEAKKA
jgi:hypothetical protein